MFFFTSLPVEVRSIVISVYVCLSVCPLVYLKNHTSKFHLISVHVTCGRGSILSSGISVVNKHFRFYEWRHGGENKPESKTTRTFRLVCQEAAPIGRKATLFGRHR